MYRPSENLGQLAPVFGPGNKKITWYPTSNTRPHISHYDISRGADGKIKLTPKVNYPSYPNRRYIIPNI